MKRRILPLVLSLGILPAAAGGDVAPATRREEAIAKGVAFLAGSQNEDGSWGSLRDATPFVWGGDLANPETHRGWRVATTGLACRAILAHGTPAGAKAALDRGVGFLLANTDLKRPSDWDVEHVWGWICALDALAAAEPLPAFSSRKREIAAAADRCIGALARMQGPAGGWGYYDFGVSSAPSAWATSFTTASGILALHDAKAAGHAVPKDTLEAGCRALERARLPSGAYLYSITPLPRKSEVGLNGIGNVKGSLGRIQAANLALFRERRLKAGEIERGIGLLLEHHRFLDIACYRHVPHEVWYRNSGYFYLYAHAHAGRSLRHLPPEPRARLRPLLDREVLKHQLADGSFWDWPFHGYAKPYGTAFALLALAE